jgi:class 3 adenylate cyclase
MQSALKTMNEGLERERGVRLAARIGVNTGEVVAGDSATRQTLVTDDAVNVAARLEQKHLVDSTLARRRLEQGSPMRRLPHHPIARMLCCVSA